MGGEARVGARGGDGGSNDTSCSPTSTAVWAVTAAALAAPCRTIIRTPTYASTYASARRAEYLDDGSDGISLGDSMLMRYMRTGSPSDKEHTHAHVYGKEQEQRLMHSRGDVHVHVAGEEDDDDDRLPFI